MREGDQEEVRTLVSEGADVNELYEESVSAAVGNQILSYRLLHLAVEAEDGAMVDLLLDLGADPDLPDAMQETPLHDAVFQRSPALVEKLLAAGADPNVADDRGLTPLHYVALRGSQGVAQRLVAAGADANRQVTEEGFFPTIEPDAVMGSVKLAVGMTPAEAARAADRMPMARYLGSQQTPPYVPERDPLNAKLRSRRRR